MNWFRWWLWRHFDSYRERHPITLKKVSATVELDGPTWRAILMRNRVGQKR